MSVQQPGVSRPTDEADSFPDPKRSWGRSGSLFATWVVLLVGIYFAGWVFDGLVDKTAESNLDKPAESPKQLARRVLVFTMVDRDPSKAEAVLCEGFSGFGPDDLADKLADWEDESGSVNVTPTFDKPDGVETGDGILYHTRADYGSGSYVGEWYFDITVRTADDALCVSKIEDVTPPED